MPIRSVLFAVVLLLYLDLFCAYSYAVTSYTSLGWGKVTILSWTDETQQIVYDPIPPDIVVSTDWATEVDFARPPAESNESTFFHTPDQGHLRSWFSVEGAARGQSEQPLMGWATSDWLGIGKIIIDNANPFDLLVDVQLDYEISAEALTDSPESELGFSAVSIDLNAYTGNIFSDFVVSDTRSADGLVVLSGIETRTVRIPALGMDEINIEINSFGRTDANSGGPGGGSAPEPTTAVLGVIGFVGLAAALKRRHRV